MEQYVRHEDVKIYKAMQFDGTKKCAEKMMAMCSHNECMQYIDGKGLLIATIDGYSCANVNDYIICGDNECIHPVSQEYFDKHYLLIQD